MSKRNGDKLEYYKSKIRRLQNKSKNRRRVIIYSSSSDSEDNNDVGAIQNGINIVTDTNVDGQQCLEVMPESVPEVQPPPGDQPDANEELDPALLLALGDAANEEPGFGEKIHQSLALRWLPILKKGLSKELKEKLLKEYLIPENCKLLKAPTLNAEISAAVVEIIRNRDKNILTKQDQLGQGIATISRAITLLLLGDDKVQAIKILTDGCRLLTDLHFMETEVRTKLITPRLEKSFLTVLQNQERDEYLFGNNLPEKIKASKAIEKQGGQIKKSFTTLKSTIQKSTPSTSKPQHQGNWMGPPRYAMSSRGGRAAMSSAPYPPPPPATYRRPPPTTATRSLRGRPRLTRQ